MLDEFTSTGAKFFAHEEAMTKLRNGRGQPITTHVMPTDICQHDCTFCSVANRPANVLPLEDILSYLDTLIRFGLKSVIISGGGNPILYKHEGSDINDLIREIHARGLEIGMISNGMSLRDYGGRRGWATVRPETLDKLTWLRISMSGLDHTEKQVFVPDVDKSKTTLGFSYVYYDETRDDWLQDRIGFYVEKHQPTYVRLLPNCLEVSKIPKRVNRLREMALNINPDVVFVQYKPPQAPNVCYLGYVHPVLNSDGFVFPCDSCVLNEGADHKFNEKWRICHWSEIEKLYTDEVRSLVDPKKMCPGCVFSAQNNILEKVRVVGAPSVPTQTFEHVNFV